MWLRLQKGVYNTQHAYNRTFLIILIYTWLDLTVTFFIQNSKQANTCTQSITHVTTYSVLTNENKKLCKSHL